MTRLGFSTHVVFMFLVFILVAVSLLSILFERRIALWLYKPGRVVDVEAALEGPRVCANDSSLLAMLCRPAPSWAWEGWYAERLVYALCDRTLLPTWGSSDHSGRKVVFTPDFVTCSSCLKKLAKGKK